VEAGAPLAGGSAVRSRRSAANTGSLIQADWGFEPLSSPADPRAARQAPGRAVARRGGARGRRRRRRAERGAPVGGRPRGPARRALSAARLRSRGAGSVRAGPLMASRASRRAASAVARAGGQFGRRRRARVRSLPARCSRARLTAALSVPPVVSRTHSVRTGMGRRRKKRAEFIIFFGERRPRPQCAGRQGTSEGRRRVLRRRWPAGRRGPGPWGS
jgi:hypothetical protein